MKNYRKYKKKYTSPRKLKTLRRDRILARQQTGQQVDMAKFDGSLILRELTAIPKIAEKFPVPMLKNLYGLENS